MYLFGRSAGGNWTQQAYIKASNTDASDQFGWRFSLDGDLLGIGALGERSHATGINGNQVSDYVPGAGAVYLLEQQCWIGSKAKSS